MKKLIFIFILLIMPMVMSPLTLSNLDNFNKSLCCNKPIIKKK